VDKSGYPFESFVELFPDEHDVIIFASTLKLVADTVAEHYHHARVHADYSFLLLNANARLL
jgi:hypothetical protein